MNGNLYKFVIPNYTADGRITHTGYVSHWRKPDKIVVL